MRYLWTWLKRSRGRFHSFQAICLLPQAQRQYAAQRHAHKAEPDRPQRAWTIEQEAEKPATEDGADACGEEQDAGYRARGSSCALAADGETGGEDRREADAGQGDGECGYRRVGAECHANQTEKRDDDAEHDHAPRPDT